MIRRRVKESVMSVMSRWFTSLILSLAVLALAMPLPVHADDNVTGSWQFVMNTQGGDRTARATFKVEGKAVSGTWETTKVQGTFADGVLDLSFPFDSPEAGAGTLGIKAKLANDELTGDWSFQTYSGTLKATRVKAN
jgi:hypothetical protein